MTSLRYTKFRDIDSNVLQIIQSTRRGEDISSLVKWGKETGYLSKEGRKIILHLLCDNCGKSTDKPLYGQRKALKQGSQDAYCSKQCCSTHHAIKNSKMCRWCRRVPVSRHARYCCMGCKASASKARIINRLAMRPTQFCIRCGKEYAGAGVAYCSVKCSSAAHSAMIGKVWINPTSFGGMRSVVDWSRRNGFSASCKSRAWPAQVSLCVCLS